LVKWRRVRGTRCFELRFNDGDDLVAQGVQQIVTLDSNTMRPTPPPEEILAYFQAENPRVFPQQQFPKYQTQSETAFETQIEVDWRDLDSLEHVNNATYAAYAENATARALASVGWSPLQFKNQDSILVNRRFHIQYLAPALWGDTLNVATYLASLKPSGGCWYIEIQRDTDSEMIIRCILEWVLLDQVSGKEQSLPKSLFQILDKRAILPKSDDGVDSK
jgi:acyl-CoA thioester hydrolase